MPNWCDNELTITGPRELVDTVVARLETAESLFDFNALLPYPEKFKGKGSPEVRKAWIAKHGRDSVDGYNMGGYEWCLSHWGTKWPASDVERVDKKIALRFRRKVWYRFQTAWSPPLPIIEKLAQEYPDLRITLRFWECGMCYKGVRRYAGGNCTFESDSEYRGSRGG